MKKIYIYDTPKSREDGALKIGETDRDDVHVRIKEQRNTAGSYGDDEREYELLFECNAVRKDGSTFNDKYIHNLLLKNGIKKSDKGNNEWFIIDIDRAKYVIDHIINGTEIEIDIQRFESFPMREEQKSAVKLTHEYYQSHKNQSSPIEFLWNAKMRFGKTFTAYQLMKHADWKRVLVLTYKTAVESAWADDLMSHKDFKGYRFLSKDDLFELTNSSREEGVVCFASYQDLLQNDASGDLKAKHVELFKEEWDCIIVDEFHYGAGTLAAKALMGENKKLAKLDADEDDYYKDLDNDNLEELKSELKTEEKRLEDIKQFKTKHKLYLSGTPFKALANDQFSKEQIFNWTYTDEQSAKAKWYEENRHLKESDNPYYTLPEVRLYVYEPAEFLLDYAERTGDDGFSLNTFFEAKKGRFVNEADVATWLELIQGKSPKIELDGEDLVNSSTIERMSNYPFSPSFNSSFEHSIDHSLWYLSNVAACDAMANLLEAHPFYSSYEIIRAYDKYLGSDKKEVDRVKNTISNTPKNKSITLSCGKLTTGISVKEWNAILFLRDIKSPESYFQTAFRAQTPYYDRVNNVLKKKECYIFDFSPNRSLHLLTEYANKLSEKKGDRKTDNSPQARVTELLNYLPVLKVSGQKMRSMSATDVLKFDLSRMNATSLGERFVHNRNFNLNDEVLDLINMPENIDRVQAIFDDIKKYKKFVNPEEAKNKTPSLEALNTSQGKIKKLAKRSIGEDKKEIDPELKAELKKKKEQKDLIRELLKTLLSRIPLFMYLSHASEENLHQVLNNTQSEEEDLFRKATGITEDQFYDLQSLGMIRSDNIEGYILKFKELEDENYRDMNEYIK